MSREPSLSSPIAPQPSPPQQNDDSLPQNDDVPATQNDAPPPVTTTTRSNRPSRACTVRTAARLHAAALQQSLTLTERRQKPKKERNNQQLQRNDESPQQCSGTNKIVTPLVGPPEPSQLQRWSLRSMWELSSVLNFLNVFGPLLNIAVEFSAEELETALITPNDTLSDLHIPLLKAIPPVTRMALTRDTWITVLCRKLRDWWHWVADGDLPIVASHGVEIEVYRTLDPGVRVVILKALCDIRVEQEDIRNYIENSLKHGVQLSLFRKERIEGDSHGVNYWYEDDPVIGHRLYREIRKIELKKVKAKGSQTLPNATYQWETVATNLEEFQDVSEKLFQSNNRTEASLGKRLKNDMLPEIEKVHKRKEKLLKKQHRQALLLDNFLNMDGLGPGRSMRDRKAVTYTFDDYDRSIDEAIKITKEKPPSPEPIPRHRGSPKPEANSNGKLSGPSHEAQLATFSSPSPNSPDYNDLDEEHNPESLDRSNRRRQRPQRYSEKEFVKGLKANSDNDADIDSDDAIVGEAVYDEEYLRKRKQRKLSSSSEGDEEYHGDEENAEDEEEEEEEDCLGISEDSDEPRKFKKLSGRTRRETKLRSVDELQLGLRRSKRSIKNRINYQQYELTESEAESVTDEKSNASDEHSDASENAEYSEESQDSDVNNDNQELKIDNHEQGYPGTVDKEQSPKQEKSNSPGQDEIEGVQKMRFLDLNEVAPGSGFDDGPNSIIKDEGRDDL